MHGSKYKAVLKLPRPGWLDMSQRLRESFSKRAEVSEEAFPYVTSPGKKPKETALSQVKSQAAELRGQSYLGHSPPSQV